MRTEQQGNQGGIDLQTGQPQPVEQRQSEADYILINGQYVRKDSQQARDYTSNIGLRETNTGYAPIPANNSSGTAHTEIREIPGNDEGLLSRGDRIIKAVVTRTGDVAVEYVNPAGSIAADSLSNILAHTDPTRRYTDYDTVARYVNTHLDQQAPDILSRIEEYDKKEQFRQEQAQQRQANSSGYDYIIPGREPIIDLMSTDMPGTSYKAAIVGGGTRVGLGEWDANDMIAIDKHGNRINNAVYDPDTQMLEYQYAPASLRGTARTFGDIAPGGVLDPTPTGLERLFENAAKNYYDNTRTGMPAVMKDYQNNAQYNVANLVDPDIASPNQDIRQAGFIPSDLFGSLSRLGAPGSLSNISLNPLDYLPKNIDLSPSGLMKILTPAGQTGILSGFASGKMVETVNSSPVYRASPNDTQGFRDVLHMQDTYNTFSGGIGWINDKIDLVASGVSNSYADYTRKINRGGLELPGGTIIGGKTNEDQNSFNKRVLEPTIGAGYGDLAESYGPGLVNFGSKTIQYMNPLVGVPMAIGAVGVIGSGYMLSQEGIADMSMKAGLVYRETGNIDKTLNVMENSTFNKSFNYHIFGADIPYGEIVPVNETVRGNSRGAANITAYEQKVYHVPGLGEDLMNIASNPAAIVGGIMGGYAMGSILKGAGGAGRGISSGLDKWERGLYRGSKIDSYSTLPDINRGLENTWYNPDSIGKFGENAYKGASPEGVFADTAMMRPNVRAAYRAGETMYGEANMFDHTIDGAGSTIIGVGEPIMGTIIKVGESVLPTTIKGGYGSIFSELQPGEAFSKNEITISREYGYMTPEIDLLGEGYNYNNNRSVSNETDTGYANDFLKKYGFLPGNAYNNGDGYGFSEINTNQTVNREMYGEGYKFGEAFRFIDNAAYGFNYNTRYGFAGDFNMRLPFIGLPDMPNGTGGPYRELLPDLGRAYVNFEFDTGSGMDDMFTSPGRQPKKNRKKSKKAHKK